MAKLDFERAFKAAGAVLPNRITESKMESVGETIARIEPSRGQRRDLGLLGLRLVVGGLLMGHGAQKLFGSFGGYGLKGTASWLESMGVKPGDRMAIMAGGSEFGSGLLTALGLGWPVGPISIIGPMGVALGTAHAGKPLWVSEGGGELPIGNMAVGGALALTDPGRYSLDRLLGLKVPASIIWLSFLATAAGIAFTLISKESPPDTSAPAGKAEEKVEEVAGAELQGGKGAGASEPL